MGGQQLNLGGLSVLDHQWTLRQSAHDRCSARYAHEIVNALDRILAEQPRLAARIKFELLVPPGAQPARQRRSPGS